MAITAIALARCKLRTGTLPSNLTALVPDFLRALPRDRMDGKALRYRVLPSGGYVLYSVGEDAKDDGGDPALRPGEGSLQPDLGRARRNMADCRTPDEAAAAMKAVEN